MFEGISHGVALVEWLKPMQEYTWGSWGTPHKGKFGRVAGPKADIRQEFPKHSACGVP